MALGWRLLAGLPRSELTRLSDAQIAAHIEARAMSDVSPTRSAVLEMKDEQRAMHEGHVFLDEKCLLLAGEILRQLGQLRATAARVRRACTTRRGARCRPPSRATACRACRYTRPRPVHAHVDATRTLADGRAPAGRRSWQARDAPAAEAVMPSPEAEPAAAPSPRCWPPPRRWPRCPATSSGCRSSTGARCAAPAPCRT